MTFTPGKRPSTFRTSLGRCNSSGKAKYKTRKLARLVMKRDFPAGHFNAYRCQHCGTWHFGHLPYAVVSGAIARQQISVHNETAPDSWTPTAAIEGDQPA